MLKCIKNHLKSGFLATLGDIFEIFGGFGAWRFFDVFWAVVWATKKSKKIDIGSGLGGFRRSRLDFLRFFPDPAAPAEGEGGGKLPPVLA